MTPFHQWFTRTVPPIALPGISEDLRGWDKNQRVVSKLTYWEGKERVIVYRHSPSHWQIAFMWKHEQSYSVLAVLATTMSPPILSVLVSTTFAVYLFSSHFKYFSCHQGFWKPCCSGSWVSYIHLAPACEWNANFWWVLAATPYCSTRKAKPRLPLLWPLVTVAPGQRSISEWLHSWLTV